MAALNAQSQSVTAPLARFEVASIKPAKPGAVGSSNLFDMSGRFTAENSSLKALIQFAYEVRDFQVLGGPSWMERDTFDIVAKPEAKADSGKQNRQMVQTLLADRFQLQFHRDVKELPVYVLTVAKNGPKLQEAKDARHGIAGRPRSIESKGADMPALAATLARRLGRTVIDKTGLTGLYDFTLTFSPIDAPAVGPAGQLSPETDSAEPSIFTALQAQLGLKLESSKGPVAVLVIDRAEKPSEN